MLAIGEEASKARTDIPSQSRIQQRRVWGDDSLNMEAVPRRRLPSQELSSQFLTMENQKEQGGIPRSLYEGRGGSEQGMRYCSLSPNQEDLANSKSSDLWPNNPQEAREAEHLVLPNTAPEEVGERFPNLSASGISRNGDYTEIQEYGEEDAQISIRETGENMDEDVYLPCSMNDEEGTDRSSQLTTMGPDFYECGLPPSQEEFCGQRNHHATSNEDYYDYIEEFLGEGTLVNIDSAQTYADLQSGTIKTSVVVSAEDDGVAVKHEVEWVTRFLPTQKQK